MGITATTASGWVDRHTVASQILAGKYPVLLNTETGLVITPLEEEDHTATAEFIAKNYAESEPLARHLKVSEELWIKRAKRTFVWGKGTSIVIKDGGGKIHGVCVAYRYDDFLAQEGEVPEYNLECLRPILELYNVHKKIYRDFLKAEKITPKDIMLVTQANLDPSLRGKNITVYMMMATFLAAKQNGYKRLVTMCTSSFSERRAFAIPNSGVKIINKIEYDHFEASTGTKPFLGMNEEFTRFVNSKRDPSRTVHDIAKFNTLLDADAEIAQKAVEDYVAQSKKSFRFGCCGGR